MPKPVEHGLWRVLAIFLFGIIVGVQLALYLFDYFDDGTADVRSLLIGLGLLALGLWKFIRTRSLPPRESPRA